MALLASCFLPGFIVASLVDQIRTDIPLTDAALGLAFSVYWASAALSSTAGAKVVQRIGPTAGSRLAGGISATVAAIIALFVHSEVALIAMLALGGTSIACAAPGVNAFLARAVPASRRAFAFSLVQSSPSLGLLLAGFAVPALGEPLGWRPVYLTAAVLAVVAAVFVPRLPALDTGSDHAAGAVTALPSMRPLVLVAAAVMIGGAALAGLNGFLVAAAPSAGVSPVTAAVILAVGSALSIPLRLGLGALADRHGGDPLPVVVGLIGAAGVGCALITIQVPVTFVVGALIALTLGWSWTGVFSYAIVNRYAESVETATGIIQTGILAGGTLGPLCFGILAEAGSFTLAWSVAAAVTTLGAGAMFASLRMLPVHRPVVSGAGTAGTPPAAPP